MQGLYHQLYQQQDHCDAAFIAKPESTHPIISDWPSFDITLNPKPLTLTPKPKTLNPKLQNPKPMGKEDPETKFFSGVRVWELRMAFSFFRSMFRV